MVEVFPDPESLAMAAANAIADALAAAIDRNGRATLALSGGSTPAETYRRLAAHRGVDWSRVHVCQVDERCVPPNDSHSNWRMIRETLLAPAGVASDHAHRMEGERPPEDGARDYEGRLRDLFPGGAPALDAVVLGIGEDGHVASLFPDSRGLDERTRGVLHTEAPSTSPVRDRLTLTLPVLNAARLALFVVTGEAKRPAVARALAGDANVPASLVRPPGGRLVWLLDAAASPENVRA
jgi:6-phosphogluconolactonase